MRILLINCEPYNMCVRQACENIEGSTLTNKDLISLLKREYDIDREDYLIYDNMSDFMDAFNDEEVPYSTHFLSYLKNGE